MIKKVVLLVVFSLLSLSIVLAGGEKEYKYELGDLDKLINETTTQVNGIKKLSEDTVVTNTNKINKLINELRVKIENDPSELKDKKAIDSYLKSLTNIINFYSDVLKNEAVVREKLASYPKAIQQYQLNIQEMLDTEIKNLSVLEQELSTLERKLQNGMFDESTKNETIAKTQINAKEKEIVFARKRIDLLTMFLADYKKIGPTMDEIEEQIELFIETIRASKPVYQAAYDTAKLVVDIGAAYDAIGDIEILNSISKDIQASWRDLEVIIDELIKVQTQVSKTGTK